MSMLLNQINACVQDDLNATNALILKQLHSHIELIGELGQHIVQSGGKRLRPLVVLLAAKLCQYPGDGQITLAAMIELIHTATLLHDDVVDASQLRRGKQTANAVWGNQASVLVGDYLYSQSFQMMVTLNNFEIFSALSLATKIVAEGEILQLQNCHNPDTTMDSYMQVIRCKTGTLFAAAAEMSAIIAKRSPEEIKALSAYGMHLGTAFQLIDDTLDYCADPLLTGKNLGDDLAEGKLTLPLLHALKQGNPTQQQLIRRAISQGNQDDLSEIIKAIESTKGIDYTSQIAKNEIDCAVTALSIFPDCIYRQALIDLTTFALNRQY